MDNKIEVLGFKAYIDSVQRFLRRVEIGPVELRADAGGMVKVEVRVGNCAEAEVAGGRSVPYGPGADGEGNEQDKRDQDSSDCLSRRAAAKLEDQDPCDDEDRKEE